MVTILDGFVHFGTIRLDVGTHQNMVNAEIHAVLVVTDAGTITATCISIIQFLCQPIEKNR